MSKNSKTIERVKITELQLDQKRRGKEPMTRKEIAEAVFAGDTARASTEELSDNRKQTLISDWDNGKSLTACKPRHLLRLSKLVGKTDINDLIEA